MNKMFCNGDSTAETMETIRKSLQRPINCLSEDSKITRKRALKDLQEETITRKLGGTLLQELAPDLLKPALKCIADSSEINREIAIKFASDYIQYLPHPDQILFILIPILVERLGQQEITEPSEELRQMILDELVSPSLELSGKKISLYLDELIQILQRTLIDPFAEVRKSSCRIAGSLAKTVPESFHLQSESLIQPLMKSMTHQHSKVRISVIEATADVIQYGNGKSVDDVISHLAQRFFDPSAQVRMCVTKVIGRWLLELPDRYSFFYKFIPLILTSFNDDMPDIRKEGRALWHKAGLLFQEENEKDLKDKMDFMQPLPKLYPENVERPCLGCRELVQRNLSKLMSAITRELSDWISETRVKTAQLLYELLVNAEEYTTQHLQPLNQALLRACGDDQPLVIASALKCCNLIGAFVKPEVFCKIILPSVQINPGSHVPLRIIAATVNGCNDEVLGENLNDIMKVLIDSEVCQASEKVEYHIALLECVNSITQVCKARVDSVSLDLFTVVVTVLALSNDEDVHTKCNDCLNEISSALNCNQSELYSLHTKQVLDSMKSTFEDWTNHSVEQLIFEALLSRCGDVVGEVLAEVMPMLEANLGKEKDPEMKQRFFTLLSMLLLNADHTLDSKKDFTFSHVEKIITKMIVPNLIWRGGRTHASVRTIATATLWSLMRSGLVDQSTACKMFPVLLPQLKSTLDDDVKTTRLNTAKVLTRLLSVCGTQLSTDDVLHQFYPELLKRLDDSSDEIRIAITKTWMQYFKCFHGCYDEGLYRAHLEAIFGGLLVHMDDPDHNIQSAVLEVLKNGAQLSPTILIQEINKTKNKHRTTVYCNQLIEYVTNVEK